MGRRAGRRFGGRDLSERPQAGSLASASLAGARALILGSGLAGHEVQCLGLAAALGLNPKIYRPRPRPFYKALAPYGPADPAEGPGTSSELFCGKPVDIVFAAGRATIPYLHAYKRWSRGSSFCVALQDPRWRRSSADLIWVPEHDRLRGPRVVVTATSPHPLGPAIAAACASPDPRVSALAPPRAAFTIGGPSASCRYGSRDLEALAQAVHAALGAGLSVMATPSRRTPPELLEAVRRAAAPAERCFIWDGAQGENPYPSILALADVVLTTADSANMISEALSVRAPVYVYEPIAGTGKLQGFVDRLKARGALRRWAGVFECWSRDPIDATAEIAAAVRERYADFRGRS